MNNIEVCNALELGAFVLIKASSNCFKEVFERRGGIPFNAQHFQLAMFKAEVTMIPSMFKGNKKRRKHSMFVIDALDPDHEGWEFEEFEIGLDVEILLVSTSKQVIITKEMLEQDYDNLKKI